MEHPSLYQELYALMRPHMTHEQAQYCAVTLSVMPTDKALALVNRAIKEVAA